MVSADRGDFAGSFLVRLTGCAFCVALLALVFWSSEPAAAFDGHTVTEGPLTVSIAEINGVTKLDTPYDVVVTLTNTGTSALSVQLRMEVIDEWYPVGGAMRQVTVHANGTATTTFRIAAGQGALSALYPVHIYADSSVAGQSTTAHAVRVFQTQFSPPPSHPSVTPSPIPPNLRVNVVHANGVLQLWTSRTHRVAWAYLDQPFQLQYMPMGWLDNWDAAGIKAGFVSIARGTTKQAIWLCEPTKPTVGSVFVEYWIELPFAGPIKLTFANAKEDGPKGDGVLFRVWVDDAVLFERQTTSQEWVNGEVDLSDYAGQTVLLRLESHPGWNGDARDDMSYWGEPIVIAGDPPEARREQLRMAAREQVTTGAGSGRLFSLDGGYRGTIMQAATGISDAIIAIGNQNACVTFDGLKISVLNQEVGGETVTWRDDGASLILTQSLRVGNGAKPTELTVRFWSDRSGLRIKVDCPERITDFALGRADQQAPHVYYAHGYCIVEPEAFLARFIGGDLATSHVGFDFEKGLSLLVACDYPPDCLEVIPGDRVYTLHTHLDATMTLVPSAQGAFDGARRYRALYDKKPAGGFSRKAGRFVINLAQLTAVQDAQMMQQLIDYGFTDSMLIIGNWAGRSDSGGWAEIYPPSPQFGTVEQMQQIGRICAAHDIPWSLIDQYIALFPNAIGFSFEHVCFEDNGAPTMMNYGDRVYLWRPDHILPFVQRNLSVIKPNIGPTAYSFDTLGNTSFEYHDRKGGFHSMLEMQRSWGEAVAWVRNYLGGNAPTTGEGGHDQLVGYLDGADCNFFQLTPTDNGEHHIELRCQDWECAPWFDAVLHDRFSLHGMGMSDRYEGGRSREHHGIESDDYLSAEILTGHAMMIDYRGLGRPAIHKYWLAQDFIRSIAFDTIASVGFVGGDIHRQVIDWSAGAKVYVNRGASDWQVTGKTLPQYGYYAKNGEIESSIERIGNIIVDQARAPLRWYFNARGSGPGNALAIQPRAESVQYLGNRNFKLITIWEAYEPVPKDAAVLLGFTRVGPADGRSDFNWGAWPTPAANTWAGTIRLGDNWIIPIPPDCRPGQYTIVASLSTPGGDKAFAWTMMNANIGGDTPLGTLTITGSGHEIDGISLTKAPPDPEPCRWNLARVPVDFGPALTEGAFRCEKRDEDFVVTPMLYFAPFSITLRLQQFNMPTAVQSVTAVDASGTTLRNVSFTKTSDALRFQTQRDEFAYVISETPFSPPPVDPGLPVNVVSPNSSLALWTLRTQRVAWGYINQPLQYMPVGWMNDVPSAGLKTDFQPKTLGTTKQAIFLRPPYVPTPGTVFVEYQIALPASTLIKMTFANAMETGNQGDGILFRVWVGSTVLFERQTINEAWLDGEADLSAYAGQTILLRLESHPGLALNTRDDRSYWGEPTVVAGNPSGGSRR